MVVDDILNARSLYGEEPDKKKKEKKEKKKTLHMRKPGFTPFLQPSFLFLLAITLKKLILFVI